jgi:tetratricopeptide (TPR) repeat protein
MFLVILVFIVFGQTIHFDFVNYDDDLYVYENQIVLKGLTLEGVAWAVAYGEIGHWHPLTWVSHMLDCQLFGRWAGGHHLTSVVLHAMAAVLLFLLFFQMTGAVWRSAFVAAVWAIHPLRAESVAWISERKDVLGAVFFMLTLGAYIRYLRRPSTPRNVLMVVVFALGLLSKNMLVTFPCLLLLLDYWPFGRLNQRSQFPLLLEEKIPLFILSALSCIITFLAPEKVAATQHLSLSLRLQNALISCCIYLRQTVWPTGLVAYYPNPSHSFSFPNVTGSLALLCLLTGAAIALRKRHPSLLIGWLWFMGMLIPVIGLVQISNYAHADRYTYLPQIGLILGGTWTLADCTGEWRQRRMALISVGAVVPIVFLVLACKQTSYWRDSETLWMHTLQCIPDNPLAHNNLGFALLNQGRTEEAITQYHEALQINPAYAEARNNLGIALLNQGRTEEAVVQWHEALQINPANAEAHCNLGIALNQQGRMDEAITHYGEALRINPDLAAVHYNLGIALFQQLRIEEAIVQWREALRINPAYADAHCNLGIALFQQGRIDEAVAQYGEALRINPAHASAHCNLGNALLLQGQTDEAIAQYGEALRINPAYAEAHSNLGGALFQQLRIEEAITQWREAIRINPAYADAHYNLSIAMNQQGRTEEAIAHAQKALELLPASFAIQNHLAWMLSTARQAYLRNGTRALELAIKANQSSGSKHSQFLRTLAAAYAETGQFQDAVKTAQDALQIAESQFNTELADDLRREIKLYASGQRFEDVH